MAMKGSIIDKIFTYVYFTGVGIFVFMAGALVIRYNLPPARSLINGFIAAEAYIKAMDEADSDKKLGHEIRDDLTQNSESVIQNPEVTWDKQHTYNGYTLVSTGYLSFPYLVDMNGKIVYRWRIPVEKVWSSTTGCTNMFKVGVYFVDRAHLYPNGDVVAQFADWGAPYGCGIIKVDKDSNILWSYNEFVHHDSAIDSKGNIFTIVQKTVIDPVPGFEALPYPITADYVVKLSSEGKEQLRIPIIDAFKDTPYQLMLLHSGQSYGDDAYDYFHTNSIDVLNAEDAAKFPLFKAGQILISIRALSILAVIDPDTKKVVWAYHTFFRFQHAAGFLHNGHIIVLDNRGHIDNGQKPSRVIELNPVTLGVEWSFIGTKEQPFNTESVGRLQRLPNGNTLIAESEHARILEITKEGKLVWSYKLEKKLPDTEYSEAIFNAERFTEDQLPFLKTVEKETDKKPVDKKPMEKLR